MLRPEQYNFGGQLVRAWWRVMRCRSVYGGSCRFMHVAGGMLRSPAEPECVAGTLRVLPARQRGSLYRQERVQVRQDASTPWQEQ